MSTIPHDRLFKQLLRTFFLDFLKLFVPKAAAYIHQRHIEFLDKEVFTDIDSGERHEVDLLARARFHGHDAFFLIHTETQANRQRDFPGRMFRYFARLHEKHRLPVYPIALLSHDSPRYAEPDGYQVSFPDKQVLDFRYTVIQLNRLNWRDYLKYENPCATALMSKMKIDPKDRPRVKLECLRLLATLKLNRAKARLISVFVDQYLKLNAAEEREFHREIKTMPSALKDDVLELTNSWEDKGHKKGLELGMETGRHEGQVDLLMRMLRRQIGPLQSPLRQKLVNMPRAQLERFGEAMLGFRTPADAEDWFKRAASRRPASARRRRS